MNQNKSVAFWLLTGVFMIYIQVILGGITRLSGSGLSITKWEIVTGTLPPLGHNAWEKAFDNYKASPQYQKINRNMTLPQFKKIFFWEWFHRLWARSMGFVFLIPFLWFLYKRKFNRKYLIKVSLVFLLGAMVGIFGWLMVKSGLEDRPSVSPYLLAAHLLLALLTMAYTFRLALEWLQGSHSSASNKKLSHFSCWIIGFLVLQVTFGAVLSGMHGALYYPTWPDMGGRFMPEVMHHSSNWTLTSFRNFETNLFPIAFIHFFHRMIAYSIFLLIMVFLFIALRQHLSPSASIMLWIIPSILTAQIVLGIYTVLGAIGHIPVTVGVWHQAVGILLLFSFLFMSFQLRVDSPKQSV